MNKTIFYTLKSSKNPIKEKPYLTEKFNLDLWVEEKLQTRPELRNVYSLLKSGDTLIVKSLRDVLVYSEIVPTFLLLMRDLNVDIVSLGECFNSKTYGWEQTIQNSYKLYDTEEASNAIYIAYVRQAKELSNILKKYKIPTHYIRFLPRPNLTKINFESEFRNNAVKKPNTRSKLMSWLSFGDKAKL